jgi:hypothetical protein
MPAEGAPAILRERIAEGRATAIGRIAAALPALVGTPPDPELTAQMLSTLSDEVVRLHLADPDRYPVDRLLSQARWFLGRVLSD